MVLNNVKTYGFRTKLPSLADCHHVDELSAAKACIRFTPDVLAYLTSRCVAKVSTRCRCR